MPMMFLVLFGAAILVTAILVLIFALVGGWMSRHRGIRAGAIAATVVLASLIIAVVGYALFGGPHSTTPVLHTAAPVTAGSGLYSAQHIPSSSSQAVISRTDARTGAIEWQRTLPIGPMIPRVAVSDGVLYAAGGQGVWALRGSDGTQLWHTTLTAALTSPPPEQREPTSQPSRSSRTARFTSV